MKFENTICIHLNENIDVFKDNFKFENEHSIPEFLEAINETVDEVKEQFLEKGYKLRWSYVTREDIVTTMFKSYSHDVEVLEMKANVYLNPLIVEIPTRIKNLGPNFTGPLSQNTIPYYCVFELVTIEVNPVNGEKHLSILKTNPMTEVHTSQFPSPKVYFRQNFYEQITSKSFNLSMIKLPTSNYTQQSLKNLITLTFEDTIKSKRVASVFSKI